MLDSDLLELDAIFRVGRVSAVEGRRVKVTVDKLKNGSHMVFRGAIVRNAGVGGYVKIVKGFVDLIAKVDGEYVHEDRLRTSTDYRRSVDKIARTLELSLVGFLHEGRFERGVRELPLLDNECFILSEEEFRLIHQFAPPEEPTFRVGALATEPTQPVDLGVDAIFASHIGVFGNTGSGKSYTVAKLYHEVFQRFGDKQGFLDRARFVLVDFNGEYVDRARTDEDDRSSEIITGPSLKTTYVLNTRVPDGEDRLPFPAEVLADSVFWTVLLDATEKTQAPFITRVLNSDRWERLLEDPRKLMRVVADVVLRATKTSDLSVDRRTAVQVLREIEGCLGDAATVELAQVISRFATCLKFHSQNRTFYWQEHGQATYADNVVWDGLITSPIAGLGLDFSGIDDIDLIRFKLVLQYYEDIVSGYANREHLSPLIKRMDARVPDIKKLVKVSNEPLPSTPLTVVSLRSVNLAMRKVVPMLLCKQLYDQKKASDPAGERYLNLIIDEAHNILSTQSTRESDAWRDYRLETFEEIVKEGRKFGVFLTIASQRPHDISETIISQLHNYFLHRLVNSLDIRAIEKAVAYLDAVSFESIPILATGTCVVAGVSAQVPVIAKVGQLPRQAEPNSRTMSVSAAWTSSVLGNAAAG
ncbi:ATP-binding protein [Conexibacter stalactiti]|uniref:ATP-binding protein n=1 Tax=Conexibacter stalactiti TaxID=1940611 RepID=A0ABU4HJB0_9ACTN|nr:ATP-binding protein [Conexibacter stalactiti]MDW5593410.1 ATP-binding protein [Conexibacter stalactiti]MEC5034051.1 ATP-binding protein [Conexibacter stalactiti]